jgi:hypothetical protein
MRRRRPGRVPERELPRVFLDPSRVTSEDVERLRGAVSQALDDVRELNGPDGLADLRLPRSRTGRRFADRRR